MLTLALVELCERAVGLDRRLALGQALHQILGHHLGRHLRLAERDRQRSCKSNQSASRRRLSFSNEMDTGISASAAARLLRTSVPRIVRALERLELDVERGPGRRVRLRESHLRALRAHLGMTPNVADLSLTETKVLAALARAPLGIASVRAVAGRAGVSPTAAGDALRRLTDRGLVLEERRSVAAGKVSEARILRANVAAPEWSRLATPLTGVVLTPAATARRSSRVPARLGHLFWNVSPRQLEVERHGGFIARRLLQGGDLEGLAWGAANLTREDWAHAGRARGLDSPRRALARNLAAAAR